jgi:tryptophan halogenase
MMQKLVIAGGGTAGWMAAAVLSRALGPLARITLVESEEIGTIGVGEATIPQVRHLLAFLGMPEADFLRATAGTYKLGIAFSGWGARDAHYIHAFGDVGMTLGLVPFHHHWLRARALGDTRSFWDFSATARAAFANRYGVMEDAGHKGLGGLRQAYHIDASLLARTLRAQAEGRGVVRVEGRIASVMRAADSGDVTALRMQDGREVEGDVFLDATGFRALLIGDTLDSPFESWSRWLLCDRAVAVSSAPGPVMRPYTQAGAREAGWQWRIPLQHRVGNGHVYASALMGDERACETLLANLEGETLAEPRVIAFRSGQRLEPWRHNVIALGLAAGFIEPLESTAIHLVQSALNRLIALMPGAGPVSPTLRDAYNRETRAEMEEIRDFIILHYKATVREDTPFWAHVKAMDVPVTLSDRIALFRETGRIMRREGALFTEHAWLQVMLGQGIMPQRWLPMADALEPQRLTGFLNDIDALIARAVERLARHEDHVRNHCAMALA